MNTPLLDTYKLLKDYEKSKPSRKGLKRYSCEYNNALRFSKGVSHLCLDCIFSFKEFCIRPESFIFTTKFLIQKFPSLLLEDLEND